MLDLAANELVDDLGGHDSRRNKATPIVKRADTENREDALEQHGRERSAEPARDSADYRRMHTLPIIAA